jgi:cobalamin biosynthesis Mg chelatase CobN
MGDALSSLNALLAFEAVNVVNAANFCKDNFLHLTSLREMAALHKQLLHMLALPSTIAVLSASGHAGARALARVFAPRQGSADQGTRSLGALQGTQGDILRRCIASGWPDQIGRRVRTHEHLTQLAASVRSLTYLPSHAWVTEQAKCIFPSRAVHFVLMLVAPACRLLSSTAGSFTRAKRMSMPSKRL